MRLRTSIVAICSLALAVMLMAPIATAGTSGELTKVTINTSVDQVCDPTADYFLGKEDYGAAIASHRRVIEADQSDAIAHYHLGFAYGMTGDRLGEIAAYRKAVALGLRQWDLYLNMGRALLENSDLNSATEALNIAVALAPQRPEPHFNLGLAYERRGLFDVALNELRTSLRLDPRQPDASNMIGLIYAEQHDYPHARQIWSELARTEPDFAPARLNLAILDRVTQAPKVHAPTDRNMLRTAFIQQ